MALEYIMYRGRLSGLAAKMLDNDSKGENIMDAVQDLRVR